MRKQPSYQEQVESILSDVLGEIAWEDSGCDAATTKQLEAAFKTVIRFYKEIEKRVR
ncbi:MAG: hypothetical protein ACRD19_12665 [Terriglobia bacterium]